MFRYASLAGRRSLRVSAETCFPGSSTSVGARLVREAGLQVDPLDDMDALEELGDEIATLAAHIHAATQRMLVLLADFNRRRGWEIGGHRSCAHWLAYRTGLDLGAARERVRTARKLVALPQVSASMGRGELSFSQVRALTRVATAENEEDLLELARGATTAQLERVVRGWKRGSRRDQADWERERHDRRTLSVFPDEDGMYRVTGRLEPEVGALLMRAIESASDALFRRDRAAATEQEAREATVATSAALPGEDATLKAAAQRRADALGLLAERAMAVGFGGEHAPVSGTRAARYQVVLHVAEDALREGSAGPGGEGDMSTAEPPDRSHLEDGTRVSAETSRRLSCDAGLVRITTEQDSSVLDVGRRTRTIPPALRRALEARDQGCRFPGCGLRFTDGHHVRHWADGGKTNLANTVLLCRYHHRLVHEGGWRVEWWGAGQPVFFDPRGGTHFDRCRNPREGTDVDGLIEANRLRGVVPDHRTAGARWKRQEDVPDGVLLRAMEAVA